MVDPIDAALEAFWNYPGHNNHAAMRAAIGAYEAARVGNEHAARVAMTLASQNAQRAANAQAQALAAFRGCGIHRPELDTPRTLFKASQTACGGMGVSSAHPFDVGYEACERGARRSTNPHPEDSKDFDRWDHGWIVAEEHERFGKCAPNPELTTDEGAE